ncbi:Translation initiation factor IF3-2, chloroplastic [Orobanche gracilis]
MAGLTSTFHQPCRPQLFKPIKPIFFHLHSFSLRIHSPNTIRDLSISTAQTPISARYGGGGAGGVFQTPKASKEDESLDISSIESANVRLIDEQQKMVGIVSKSQAIQMAEDAELDLVILSPDANPPVVKIMNYEIKYRYEQQQKKRDQQKKSAANRMDLKELKMGYNIDVHDYSVRLKAAQKFLKDGDKVKAIVKLKGRENGFRNNAIELLRRFQNDVGELAVEEAKNFRDRNMFVLLVPNKALVQKSQERLKRKDDSEIPASVN